MPDSKFNGILSSSAFLCFTGAGGLNVIVEDKMLDILRFKSNFVYAAFAFKSAN